MIKVKTPTGKEIKIDIEPADTIDRIKKQVWEKEGIPPVQQRYFFLHHLYNLGNSICFSQILWDFSNFFTYNHM